MKFDYDIRLDLMVSKDDYRPAMQYIYIDVAKNRAVVTDSYTMGMISVEFEGTDRIADKEGILIPPKVWQEACKKKLPIEILESGNYRVNGLEFIIEPIKEKFPPYESVWEPAIQEPYILRQLTTQYLGIICKVFGKSKLLRLKFPKNGKKLIIFGDGWEENIGLIMPCRIEGTTDDIQED